ncbi:MAG: hypothetical protein KY431_10090 [Actinobacteria bacterium]|nr:hypothetical protein [Actinomycetota bacterium]
MVLALSTACNSGSDGRLSRAPEQSSELQGGPFCGPFRRLSQAKLDLIRRATSNVEIESTIELIRELQQEISQEAPPEVRDDVQFTVRVYGTYLNILEAEGYGKAPMEDITTDEFNAAELAQQSYCFQNPTR